MRPATSDRPRVNTKDTTSTLFCPNCGVEVLPMLSRKGPHLRADCSVCGKYITFVPQRPPWSTVFEAQEIAWWLEGGFDRV